jgi:hypothetical protein
VLGSYVCDHCHGSAKVTKKIGFMPVEYEWILRPPELFEQTVEVQCSGPERWPGEVELNFVVCECGCDRFDWHYDPSHYYTCRECGKRRDPWE